MGTPIIQRAWRSARRRARYNLHPRAVVWNYWRRTCPDRPVVTSLGGRLKVRIYPHDVIGKYIYVDGAFEPTVWNFVKNHLRPGMTVCDLGANLGQYTLLAAMCVGGEGQVHAFEPSSRIFRELEFNVRLNHLSDVCVLNQVAVSNVCATARLSRYEEGAEVYGSLGSHARVEAAIVGYEAVQTVRLDDYIKGNGVARVDFIKMDIEGAELLALQGAEGLLSRSDAPTILLEMADVNTDGFGYKAVDIWDYLEELGYEMSGLRAGGEPVVTIRRPNDFVHAANVVARKAGSSGFSKEVRFA